MKKLSILALSATLMTAPAFAESNVHYSTNALPTQSVDLSAVFDNTDNLQVATLSQQEMQETEGAVLPFVAGVLVGGAIGAWGNHASSRLTTGKWASTRSTLAATGAGMIGGGYSNVMLRGAGIATSPFSRSAWRGANGVMNATIRTNGIALGQSYSGVYGKRAFHRHGR